MIRRALIALWLLGTAAAADPAPTQMALISSARTQVGVTIIYDPSYQSLAFPGGDIERARGVCTDVIIRAMRDAWEIDLQLAVNRDMKAAFSAYPQIWGLRTTDRNIDHRRVPNLQTLLIRADANLETSSDPTAYRPGDIVTWMLPGNLPHIGIVGDRRSPDGLRPLILHNIGWGAREEDMLFDHQITGHYRITSDALERLKALGTR